MNQNKANLTPLLETHISQLEDTAQRIPLGDKTYIICHIKEALHRNKDTVSLPLRKLLVPEVHPVFRNRYSFAALEYNP